MTGRFELRFADDTGYRLVDQAGERQPLAAALLDPKALHRIRAGGRELVARAAKAGHGVSVLDCTAGLGADSLVLAARGCTVTMIERSTTLALMLEDALQRVRLAADWRADLANRMSLVRGDALSLLRSLSQNSSHDMARPPDVIMMDPMFPVRSKRAAVRGELQTLQTLLGKDEPVEPLLHAALATGCHRVLVKRPLRAPALPATYSVSGKASRFDVFIQ